MKKTGINIYKWLTKTRRRKILSSILAALIILTSIRFAFFNPKVILADSFFKFDEGYGTTNAVNDSNGNVATGSITNAVWKTEDLCKSGMCLYFDGTGDYVSFADDANLDMAASDTVTIGLWFRTGDITSGTRTLISKYETTGADGGYKVNMNSSGQIVFGIDNDNSGFPAHSVTSTNSYDDNKWHFVSAVKNGTASMTLYVDAISVATANITSTDASNNDSFYIGIDNGSSDGWLGFIDEVMVMRTARTTDEIKTDYAGQTPDGGTSASFGPDNSWLSNGLVGYWKLNELSGNATDSSGNGLTLTNSGTTTFVGGKYGNGSEHVPASTQYFSTATAISGVQSVSFWVNPDSTTNYYLSLSSGAYITSTSGTLSATGFTGAKIFVNGIETATVAADSWQLVTVTSTAGINANQFYLGRQGSNYFDGTLDDVRLYNRLFTPSEIVQLFSYGPDPIGWWKMDENTGTSTADASSNGHTSTFTNMDASNWRQGKFGSGLYFNGSDEYIDVSTSYQIPSQAGSVSVWVRPEIAGGNYDVLSSGASLNDFRISPQNNLYGFYIGAEYRVSYATDPITNQWTHIGLTWDQTNGSILYINGVRVASNSTPPPAYSQTGMKIGSNTTGGENFRGIMDEVKVYNYARTPAQIIQDRNAGHPAPGSPVGSSLGYWKFDEPEGYLIAYDSSGNNRNLSINTGASCVNTTAGGCHTEQGLFGRALNPGGSYETTSNDTAFSFGSNSFSVSTWVKSGSANNPAASEYILVKGGPISPTNIPGYILYFNTSGQIVYAIDDDTTWGPEDTINTTEDYYDNTWHHVVITKLNNTDIELLVDGVSKATKSSITASGSLGSTGTLILGDLDAVDNGNELNGFIDETSIYNSNLTIGQVQLLYNQGKTAVFGALSTSAGGEASWSADRELCIPGDTTSCNPPFAEWLFDENTGTTAYNKRQGGTTNTQGGDGTLTLLDTNPWVKGKFGQAIKFDGVDGYVTTTSFDQLYTSATNITLSAWVKFNTLSDTATIISRRQNANNRIVMGVGSGALGGGNNDVYLTVSNSLAGSTTGSCYTTGNIITTGVWQHWTMVYDGTGADTGCGRIKYYLNGVEQSLTQTGTPATSLPTATAVVVTLGTENLTASTYANAIIDNPRLYNYSRTGAQVAWEYNYGAPVAWYKFDECTGTTAYNSVLNANGTAAGVNGTITPASLGNTAVGTCSSGTSTHMWNNGTIGKRNASLDFDGSDDFVDLGNNLEIPLPITLAAWVKIDSTSGVYTIIATDKTGVTNHTGAWLSILDGYLDVGYADNTACSSTAYRRKTGDTLLSVGVWYHVVGVMRGATDMDLYIDGKSESGTYDGSGGSLTYTGDSAAIGKISNCGSGNFFYNGQIDEVKVWNYALTQQLVLTERNQGAVKFGPETGSP